MNCIVIDDEKMARTVIKTLCSEVDTLQLVHEFSNAIEAIKFLNETIVDLIFLDIHMPMFSGIDFIKSLKNSTSRIILTTSDPDFAIEAFEYDCIVDYLLKPIKVERFKKAIQKVERSILVTNSKNVTATVEAEDYKKNFYININRRLIKIDLPSVYFVEADGDYIKIKTEVKEYKVHSTLKKVEEKLPKSLFFKVHRSYIINLKKIIDIEDDSVLINRDVIPVSRSKRPELMKRLDLL